MIGITKKVLFVSVLTVGLCASLVTLSRNVLVRAAVTDPTQSNSVGVEGVVRGDPPKTAATISVPTNGQTITTIPLNVSGLCTGDLLVKIFKNGVFAGSAQCSGGTYTVQTDLFNGVNELVARVYDALDQKGPDSNTVSVTYVQSGFNTNATQVSLTSIYARRGANPGDTLTWPILLSGGTGPYAISVTWGDGKTELISRTATGEFTISHVYDTPGIYTILIKVTDSGSNSAFLQLVGIANGALAAENQNVTSTAVSKTNVVWWPVAIAAFFVLLSFWLGGRFRVEQLRRQAEKRIQS